MAINPSRTCAAMLRLASCRAPARQSAFPPLLLLLAAVLFVCMAAPCNAGSARGEVFLDSDTITLGDVFSDAGDLSGKAVGPAPEPGRKIVYDVNALTRIARAFQLPWQPASTYERVTITRTSQMITSSMIRERVLEDLTALAGSKDLDVALDNQNIEIHRPTKTPAEFRIVDLKYDAVRHRFSGSLVVQTAAGNAAAPADIIHLNGRAMPMTQVAQLTRAVSAGEAISAADVTWSRIPLDKAGADAISNATQLDGMELRRAMNAETVLRLRDFARARMITKGSLVMMQVETPSMFLSAQGRALSDGAMGDTIRITNSQSNRTVDAVVVGKNKVSVMPGDGNARLASR